MKRFLTNTEIEEIMSFLKPQKNIPKITSLSIINNIKEKLRKDLQKQYVNPKIIPELKKTIEDYYYKTVISSGCSVGIIAAQSVGEKQTQSTLNTFHFTGLSEKTATTGVTRINEILNATKNPKQKSCYITFKSNNDTLTNLRNMINHSLVEVLFTNMINNISVQSTTLDWFDVYESIYNKKIPKGLYLLCNIKMNILYDYKIQLDKITSIIEQTYTDLVCFQSPESECQIIIFPTNPDDITIDDKITFINSENVLEFYLKEVVFKNLENLQICGITGITNMFIVKDKKSNTWKIETDGTNLQEVLGHINVDESLSFSNSIWEIYEVFGIEAVRQFMIDEFMKIIGDINTCHIKLVVDKMTFTGTILSISRYSIRKDDIGPLSSATFEESMDKFTTAGIFTQIENTKGVSSSIMCGKNGKFGTGSFSLYVDYNKL
jgi:DNA-directed RNA polymerase beta' subunit